VDAGAVLSIFDVPATSRLGAALSVNPDGTVRYDPTASATLAALGDGSVRTDRFVYTMTDEAGYRSRAIVTVTVTGESVSLSTASAGPMLRAPAPLEEEEIVIDLAAEFGGLGGGDPAGVSSWQVEFVAEGAESVDPNRDIVVALGNLA
jgi:hypothetical protein